MNRVISNIEKNVIFCWETPNFQLDNICIKVKQTNEDAHKHKKPNFILPLQQQKRY